MCKEGDAEGTAGASTGAGDGAGEGRVIIPDVPEFPISALVACPCPNVEVSELLLFA